MQRVNAQAFCKSPWRSTNKTSERRAYHMFDPRSARTQSDTPIAQSPRDNEPLSGRPEVPNPPQDVGYWRAWVAINPPPTGVSDQEVLADNRLWALDARDRVCGQGLQELRPGGLAGLLCGHHASLPADCRPTMQHQRVVHRARRAQIMSCPLKMPKECAPLVGAVGDGEDAQGSLDGASIAGLGDALHASIPAGMERIWKMLVVQPQFPLQEACCRDLGALGVARHDHQRRNGFGLEARLLRKDDDAALPRGVLDETTAVEGSPGPVASPFELVFDRPHPIQGRTPRKGDADFPESGGLLLRGLVPRLAQKLPRLRLPRLPLLWSHRDCARRLVSRRTSGPLPDNQDFPRPNRSDVHNLCGQCSQTK